MRRWQLAQDALRLCCASRSRTVRPLNVLSSAGKRAGVGRRRRRRRAQNASQDPVAALTGLVRSGAEVAVNTDRAAALPRGSNAWAPPTFTTLSASLTAADAIEASPAAG